MCCTSGLIDSSESGSGARNAAEPPRGTLTIAPLSSLPSRPSLVTSAGPRPDGFGPIRSNAPAPHAATHAVNRSSAMPIRAVMPSASSFCSRRSPKLVPRVLVGTSQYIARCAPPEPTRPPTSTTGVADSSASASARTVSRSSVASAAMTLISGDAARAAVAVMPTRTPSAYAAREQAWTTGLCSATRNEVVPSEPGDSPDTGSCPDPTTATAAPRRAGSMRVTH